jgi:uncharacterized protein YjbJ (UPF0337 family)
MTDPHQRSDAEHSRDGLLSSIKGKAKEVAGAALGNDPLARQGQLQQAEGSERRIANTERAIADTEADAAGERLKQENDRARAARAAVAAEEQHGVTEAGRIKDRQIASAEAQARARNDEAAAAAEQHTASVVQDAAAEAVSEHRQVNAEQADAAREHDRLLGEADAAESVAARSRRTADQLAAETSE